MDEFYRAWKWQFDPQGFRRAFSLGCNAKGYEEDAFVKEKLHMSPSTRWRWYRGIHKPGFETCIEIASMLDIPFMVLIGCDAAEIHKGSNGEITAITGSPRQ